MTISKLILTVLTASAAAHVAIIEARADVNSAQRPCLDPVSIFEKVASAPYRVAATVDLSGPVLDSKIVTPASRSNLIWLYGKRDETVIPHLNRGAKGQIYFDDTWAGASYGGEYRVARCTDDEVDLEEDRTGFPGSPRRMKLKLDAEKNQLTLAVSNPKAVAGACGVDESAPMKFTRVISWSGTAPVEPAPASNRMNELLLEMVTTYNFGLERCSVSGRQIDENQGPSSKTSNTADTNPDVGKNRTAQRPKAAQIVF